MRVVVGDLLQLALEGTFDVIVHGCNCHCAMSAGIARQIRSQFPEAFAADAATKPGDRRKLGAFSSVEIDRKGCRFWIVNAYTQYDFDGSGPLVEYDAVRRVMKAIRERFSGRRIGYPKIGAGLARGDWSKIAAIIDTELDGEDHTLVEFAG